MHIGIMDGIIHALVRPVYDGKTDILAIHPNVSCLISPSTHAVPSLDHMTYDAAMREHGCGVIDPADVGTMTRLLDLHKPLVR